jgi:hypothetical protein
VLVGILEEIDDLLQVEFGLVDDGDIPETYPVSGRGEETLGRDR